MWKLCVLLALALGVLSEKVCTDKDNIPTVKLKKHLLDNYPYDVRPVCHHKTMTNVTVRMILKYFTYDMHQSLITIHNWMPLTWIDEHLRWSPKDFDGIDTIHISSSDIWTPDLSIYNRHDQSADHVVLTTVDCLVFLNGFVVCVTPTKQDALCRPDLTKYPFDVQNCTLRYGSWVHSGEEVNFTITKPPVSLDGFTANSEWELLDYSVYVNPGHYKCCPNSTYPSISYSFRIRRHNGAHVATIFVPALVMAILTLTVLWMDPINTDRICVACCNIICHVLYIEFISWELPYNAESTPLIVLYARDSLLMSAFGLVLTVVLKGLIKSSLPGPVWLSTTVNAVVRSGAGQAILHNYKVMGGQSLKKTRSDGEKILEEDDGEGTKICEEPNSDWVLFAKVVDRLSFVAIFVAYLCMFVAFVP